MVNCLSWECEGDMFNTLNKSYTAVINPFSDLKVAITGR
nr:MAG TPA: hypothetical protein [Caudoviricetes sp.]